MRKDPSSAAVDLSDETIAEMFGEGIDRRWASPIYLFGLFVVAIVMVILPIIYLGMVGGVGYLLYYHATAHVGYLSFERGGRLRVLLYILPLFVGGILLLFMIKPLFARAAAGERRTSLVPENEPVLFAFVAALCEAVGAPEPKRIDLTCEINASASFRKGFLSFFGRDLVLTIGVPLVGGLTMREFAGVLAHEFGHFTQGIAMRLCYVIRRVNGWFYRVVYERDHWDMALITFSENEDGRVAVPILLARFLIWMTRGILWALMMVGHGVSCMLMRQMEYDADRCETELAGSEAFASTCERLQMLSVACGPVQADLSESWKEGKLGDNFSAMLGARLASMPTEVALAIKKGMEDERTKLLDTHPSFSARIRRSRQLDAEGIFGGEGPATALFNNFEATSREISFSYYRDVLGDGVTRDNLVSMKVQTQQRDELHSARSAAYRYLPGFVTPILPMRIDRYSKIKDLSPKACLAQLKEAHASLQKVLPKIHATYGSYLRADEAMCNARIVRTLLRANVRGDYSELGISSSDAKEAFAKYEEAKGERNEISRELAKIEGVIWLRLGCALSLLSAKEVGERIQGAGDMRRQSEKYLDALAALSLASEALGSARHEGALLRSIAGAWSESGQNEALDQALLKSMKTNYRGLSEVRQLLRDWDYPFEHVRGEISMADFALEEVPFREDLAGLLDASGQLVEHLDSLYIRLVGELALMAEKVESLVRLRPLKLKTEERQGA